MMQLSDVPVCHTQMGVLSDVGHVLLSSKVARCINAYLHTWSSARLVTSLLLIVPVYKCASTWWLAPNFLAAYSLRFKHISAGTQDVKIIWASM